MIHLKLLYCILQMYYKCCSSISLREAIQFIGFIEGSADSADLQITTLVDTQERQAVPHVDALVTAAYKPLSFGRAFPAIAEPLDCSKVLQLWVSEQRHQQLQV